MFVLAWIALLHDLNCFTLHAELLLQLSQHFFFFSRKPVAMGLAELVKYMQ